MENPIPKLNAENNPEESNTPITGKFSEAAAKGIAEPIGATLGGTAPEKVQLITPPPSSGIGQKPNAHVSTSAVEAVARQPGNSVHDRTGATAAPDAEKFFSLQDRLPLQVFEHESRWQKFSHLGPTFTSLAALVLTVFVWNNTARLSKQQLDLQERQTQLQEKQVEAELSDIRFKFLNDLTATDETKKISAEIGLAAHGRNALPVLYFALGVQQEYIRKSAVNVFDRMFQASATFPERDALLTRLMEQMMSPNKNLRTGIVQSLVQVGPLLNVAERQKVIVFLENKVPPQNICRDAEGRNMVKEAATFFRASDTNSIPYLIAIARNPECGDGWVQAMVKLGDVAMKQPQRRGELLDSLEQTKKEALSNLRERISDDDLTAGFGVFLTGRKIEVTFRDVQERVEQEFDRLRRILAEQ